MVEQAHFEKVKSFLDSTLKEGGKLIAGGRSIMNWGWMVYRTDNF